MNRVPSEGERRKSEIAKDYVQQMKEYVAGVAGVTSFYFITDRHLIDSGLHSMAIDVVHYGEGVAIAGLALGFFNSLYLARKSLR